MKSGYFSRENPLKEGTYHTFKFIKCVRLEDGKEYMILEDSSNTRHFVDYEPYKPYNLNSSSELVCLVDKINCTGRIYLEPEHPVYKVGQIYEFNVLTFTQKESAINIIVQDCFNNSIEVEEPNHRIYTEYRPNTIKAKILRIKKGIPEITVHS